MIDSENVGSTWIDLLQSDEKIDFYIFVTENAKSLNYALLKQLTQNPRHKINIIECEPGKNSLDFYLSSYVGYLIGKGKHLSYTVVSQDTGYDHVIEYWNREGIDVKRINTKNDSEKKRSRRNQPKDAKPAPAKSAPAKPAPVKSAPNSETRVILKKQAEEVKQDTQESKTQQTEQSKRQADTAKKQAEDVKKQQTKQVNKLPEEPKKQPEQIQKQQSEETGKQAVEAANPKVEAKETPAKPKTKKKRTKTSAKKQDDASRLMMKELLKDFSEEDQEDVCRYLSKVPLEKRSDKNYIYRGLVRKFKSEKGLGIYTLIKKDIDRYYNLKTENKQ